jgi:hypothetical protein
MILDKNKKVSIAKFEYLMRFMDYPLFHTNARLVNNAKANKQGEVSGL